VFRVTVNSFYVLFISISKTISVLFKRYQ